MLLVYLASTSKADAPKKELWKKISGHKSNLMDIVKQSRNNQKPSKGPVRNKEEDFRTRRRKLYRLMTEEKPTFPMQQRNFYNHVMENKEVVKTLSLLSTCTLEMKLVSKITFFYDN